jgi:hypothetical protein
MYLILNIVFSDHKELGFVKKCLLYRQLKFILSVILIFLIFFISCVPAQPTVNASLVKKMCRSYMYPKDGFCRDILGDRKMYGTKHDQEIGDGIFRRIVYGKLLIDKYHKMPLRESCIKVANDSSCQDAYPKCDKTSGTLRPKPVCRETCENAEKLCDKELEALREFNKIRESSPNQYPLYWNLHNCSLLPYRNGGDTPECYYYRLLNGKSINCYIFRATMFTFCSNALRKHGLCKEARQIKLCDDSKIL